MCYSTEFIKLTKLTLIYLFLSQIEAVMCCYTSTNPTIKTITYITPTV